MPVLVTGEGGTGRGLSCSGDMFLGSSLLDKDPESRDGRVERSGVECGVRQFTWSVGNPDLTALHESTRPERAMTAEIVRLTMEQANCRGG